MVFHTTISFFTHPRFQVRFLDLSSLILSLFSHHLLKNPQKSSKIQGFNCIFSNSFPWFAHCFPYHIFIIHEPKFSIDFSHTSFHFLTLFHTTTSHLTLKIVYDQPQKRVRDMCCLRVRTNLVTWVGIICDHIVQGFCVLTDISEPNATVSQNQQFWHSHTCTFEETVLRLPFPNTHHIHINCLYSLFPPQQQWLPPSSGSSNSKSCSVQPLWAATSEIYTFWFHEITVLCFYAHQIDFSCFLALKNYVLSNTESTHSLYFEKL